jgi:large conductance mechanosensitive channel
MAKKTNITPKEGEVVIVDKHGKHHHGVAVLLDTDEVVREKVGGFADFLKEYAVVGLAVGFIVGQQANGVAKQLVDSFVDPFTKVWFGQGLSSRTATLHHGTTPVKVPWGLFVFTLLEFFIVLIVIYILIKSFKLDKFRKSDAKPKK